MKRYKLSLSLLLGLAFLLASFLVACAKPAPAAFEVVSLDIVPKEVTTGDAVTVTTQVKNSGGSQGVYSATLTIDGAKVETKDVTVAPGATEKITFSLTKDKAGSYQVAVGGLNSSLKVKPKLVAKEIELKYDDDKARDCLASAGGHIVDFSPPTTPFTITKLKIVGFLSPKADKGVENKTFDLQILDKDLKVIHTVTYPYSKFSSITPTWTDFEVPDIKVNDKFYVHIYTMSPRYGLHIGADDSLANKHSDVTAKDAFGNILISAQWPYGPSSEYWFGDPNKVNWMIRVVGTAMVPQE